ncbi:MAG: hypothetical protein ACK4WH_11935 [Phycisphaerales bacterium]
MGTDAAEQAELRSIIEAALRGMLTEAQAARALALGAEVARAVMLAASARIAELSGKIAPGPHTPPGAIPPYAKPASCKRGRGRPGARDGHEGRRRPAPPIDARVEVEPLTSCPECRGPVLPAQRKRRRIVEDMPGTRVSRPPSTRSPATGARAAASTSSRVWPRPCPGP